MQFFSISKSTLNIICLFFGTFSISLLFSIAPLCYLNCFLLLFNQQVLEKCLPHLPQTEKTAILNATQIDFQWIAERSSGVWLGGLTDGKFQIKNQYKQTNQKTNILLWYSLIANNSISLTHFFFFLLQITQNHLLLHLIYRKQVQHPNNNLIHGRHVCLVSLKETVFYRNVLRLLLKHGQFVMLE